MLRIFEKVIGMLKAYMRSSSLSLVVFMLAATTHAEQNLEVKILDRQDNAQNYTYVVPSYSTSTTSANAYCSSTVNCNASSNTNTISTANYAGSYEVRGATLSLQLPDGRIAVVNCSAKINWTEWTNPNVYRSCRVPLVTIIQADFDGDKAKLKWPVSIDGKKLQTETYKILGVIDKP